MAVRFELVITEFKFIPLSTSASGGRGIKAKSLAPYLYQEELL